MIAARKNTGLSQSEFAELLGVSGSTHKEWEQLREQPTEAAQALIALALEDPKAVTIPQT